MGHPAVSSRDGEVHSPADREELTLSPELSETLAAALQNRTLRTDRLYQNDQARRALPSVPEKPAENSLLSSCPHAPQDFPILRLH
jgi:hypothetical protein